MVEKANGLNDEQKNRSFRVNRNFKTRQTLAATTELVSGNLKGLSITPSNTAEGAQKQRPESKEETTTTKNTGRLKLSKTCVKVVTLQSQQLTNIILLLTSRPRTLNLI